LWTAWSGIGAMIGPPLGGLIVQYSSWEWIFFINLPAPAMPLALAVAGRSPERLPEHPRPVQALGAATVAFTFGLLTYGLIEGAQAGFRNVLWAVRLSLAPAWLLLVF